MTHVDSILPENCLDLLLRKKIISLLDLTYLDSNATIEIITELCKKGITPLGKVAAICIPANFIAPAKDLLKDTHIAVATVANFPSANHSLSVIEQEIILAVAAGADEVDVVLPYHLYLEGKRALAQAMLRKIRDACKVKLKIILETGAFINTDLIYQASADSINAGADFIKTSTGKIPVGATLGAAEIMLTAIKNNALANNKLIGFKASGGIRTVEQASHYLMLADKIMGDTWVQPATFRFGASSLLDDALKLNVTKNDAMTY